MKQPPAIVLNMFYTGLGIARSLGSQGVRVIGLSSRRGVYGNFTRYAEVRRAPDSRENPRELLAWLLAQTEELRGAVLYPTRDDDVLFLERNRDQLEAHFRLVLPRSAALRSSLDKWETWQAATAAGIPTPRCYSVNDTEALENGAKQLSFPCVMKPVSAHHWRRERNWQAVGGRKAIAVSSADELRAEYAVISAAEPRVLVQEIVPGGDEHLWIAACYFDQNSTFVAGFTARKLLQVPEGFGTGCIVETAFKPEVLALARQLLESMQYTGIAEVEFKQDSRSGEYKLIEINPRPWDQHRLGFECGADLIHIAWCDMTGISLPVIGPQKQGRKWIADDVLLSLLIRSVLGRGRSFAELLRFVRGRRMFAIWSVADPLPFLVFAVRFMPDMAIAVAKGVHRMIIDVTRRRLSAERREAV